MDNSTKIKARFYKNGEVVTSQSGLARDFDRFVAAHDGDVPGDAVRLLRWSNADRFSRFEAAHDGDAPQSSDHVDRWAFLIDQGHMSDAADAIIDGVQVYGDGTAVSQVREQWMTASNFVHYVATHDGTIPLNKIILDGWAWFTELGYTSLEADRTVTMLFHHNMKLIGL